MQRRLLVLLLSLLALGALAVAALLSPPPARPFKPHEVKELAEPERRDTRPPVDPPRPDQPPPAPEVSNDPARGVVFVRVIDYDTYLPLVNRRCELCEVETVLGDNPASEFFWREIEPSTGEARDFDVADDHGLLAFKAVEADSKVFFNRVKFGSKLEWKYPLPPGFEPVSHPNEIAAALAALNDNPGAKPVDVFVRAAPTVHGRVWDPEGRPAAGAEVFAWPLQVAPALDAWACCHSEHYEALRSHDQAGGTTLADLVDARLELMFNDAVTPTQSRPRGSGFHVGAGNIAGPFRALTDRNGRYRLPAMFRGRWMVCAWTKASSYTAKDCRLTGGAQEVDFSLPTQPAPSLTVTVVLSGPPDHAGSALVRVRQCTPSGQLLDAPAHSFASLVGPPSFAAAFEQLPPGFYLVEATTPDALAKLPADRALVEIVADVPAQATLAIGRGTMGLWRPRVTAGGKTLSTVHALLRGGPYLPAEKVWVESDGSETARGLELPAGVYTAYLPGMKPRNFSVTAGPRATTTELKLETVRTSFVLESAFAAGVFGGRQAVLALEPVGPLADITRLMLAEVDGNWKDHGPALKPDQEAWRTLFPSEYEWTLKSENEPVLQGRLQITPGRPEYFRFGFNYLPGLARLDIDMLAYVKQGLVIPEVTVMPDGPARPTFYAPPRGFSGEDIPPSGESYVARVPVLKEREGWFTAFAEPGVYKIHAGGRTVLTRIPAMVELKPEAETGLASLVWTTRDDEPAYRVYVADRSGILRLIDQNTVVRLKTGRVEVFATKTIFDNGSGANVQFCARHTFTLAADTVLDLATLPWVAYGRFTLTCRGRGSPGEDVDAWWWDKRGWRSVKVVSWDSDAMLDGSEIDLADVSDWMPEGRAAFTFKDRSVPPGRYKVIPWPGAADKYCRMFEVRSGKHTEVVVNGG